MSLGGTIPHGIIQGASLNHRCLGDFPKLSSKPKCSGVTHSWLKKKAPWHQVLKTISSQWRHHSEPPSQHGFKYPVMIQDKSNFIASSIVWWIHTWGLRWPVCGYARIKSCDLTQMGAISPYWPPYWCHSALPRAKDLCIGQCSRVWDGI